MDSTLLVLRSDDRAKPPVMRIRFTRKTRLRDVEEGERGTCSEDVELAALKQLEFHLLNQARCCC